MAKVIARWEITHVQLPIFLAKLERSALLLRGVRKVRRRCPSCAAKGRDKHGLNLGVSVLDSSHVWCNVGCTYKQIREAQQRMKGEVGCHS